MTAPRWRAHPEYGWLEWRSLCGDGVRAVREKKGALWRLKQEGRGTFALSRRHRRAPLELLREEEAIARGEEVGP